MQCVLGDVCFCRKIDIMHTGQERFLSGWVLSFQTTLLLFLPPFSLFFPIVFLFQVAYIDLMLPWLEWICYWTRGRVKRSIWSKWEEGDVSFYFSLFYSFASSFPLNNTFSLLYTLFTLTQYFSQGIPISSSAVIVAVRACHIVYISVVAVSTNLKQSHLSSFTSDNAGRKVSGVKRI